MKLCSYVVKRDVGLSPNPFWGWCTLAVCTPNHGGARLEQSDWIAGFLTKRRDKRLLYAMKVDEVLDFDSYYRDARFEKKHPSRRGDWRDRCGDAMYYRDSGQHWAQDPEAFYHRGETMKDTRFPRVFVGSLFYYFGRNALILPEPLRDLAWDRHGFKYFRGVLVDEFISWLSVNHSHGILGLPIDNDRA